MLSTGTLAGIGSPGTGRFSPITMPVTVDVPSAVSTLSWTLDWAWDVTEPTFMIGRPLSEAIPPSAVATVAPGSTWAVM